MVRNAKTLLLATALGMILGAGAQAAGNKQKLKSAVSTQESAEKAAAASQKKIESIADQTDRMLTEYKLTMRQYDALKGYDDQVARIVKSQNEELATIDAQLLEIDTTNQGVIPLMERMVDTLEKFVALDVPFLPEERAKRIAGLKALLDRADVTVSEKYRRIMEAYQVEMEYGRTIEAYTDDLSVNGKKRSVDFLRIGRMTLMYQTLDKKETAVWDNKKRAWQILPEEYRKPTMLGLRIARKQAPPDLIKLPVPAPETAQ
ncbi:DUF3450 domain-containing protein, partial [Thiolapillus sp.]|uniref:DUF3450 domain-containing protein n=1 Tax=Thiolapillus sp. TaxID=2017437 RepID=UPI003AF5A08C